MTDGASEVRPEEVSVGEPPAGKEAGEATERTAEPGGEEGEGVDAAPAVAFEASELPGFDGGRLETILESLVFAAGAPVSLRRLCDVLGGPGAREVRDALRRVAERYVASGVRLVEVAGGFQFRTAPENAEWVRSLLREKPSRLGRAALETLAVIAYRQPVTRAEIEGIRGVDADSAVSSLLAKRLIKVAGRKEVPGRPLVYATSSEFLQVFGLKDLSELPSLKEIGPVAEDDDESLSEEPEEGRAAAEDLEPRGNQLATSGGGADSGGEGPGERSDRERARGEGRPDPGSDHDQ